MVIHRIAVWGGQSMYTLGNQSSRLVDQVQRVQKGQYHDICTSKEDHDANLINLLNVAQIEGLVLNDRIQCWGNAPLSEGDTRHYWDSPSNRQAAAGQFHRNGDIHGELHTIPLSSHWATAGNAEARRGLPLGSNGKQQLPEDKGLTITITFLQ